jgi:hypothetical protein
MWDVIVFWLWVDLMVGMTEEKFHILTCSLGIKQQSIVHSINTSSYLTTTKVESGFLRFFLVMNISFNEHYFQSEK